MLGGISLLQALVGAIGAALLVGNGAAFFRSRSRRSAKLSWSDRQNRRGDPMPGERQPGFGSLAMAALGLVICVWALASLVS